MLSIKEKSNNLTELNELATNYDVPFEDVLFIDFNRKGMVNEATKYHRVRFYFRLYEDIPYLKISKEIGVKDYFFAVPTHSGISNYRLSDDSLYLNGTEKIGTVKDLVDDTVDSTYPRKHGTVMNLNPSVKSACSGCNFCYVNLLTPNDRDRVGKDPETFLREQVAAWLKKYGKEDLSYLHRVDVVTGGFGGEGKTIENLSLIREVFSDYSYNGEIFYLGSEIATNEGLDALEEIKPFGLCLTLETFKRREELLKDHKCGISLEDAKRILGRSKNKGFGSQFTYILGLEPLDTAINGMEEFYPFVNRLPVVNVFQPHNREQLALRAPEAANLEYFLEARNSIENIFSSKDFRPRTWGNYRSLWYLKYGNVLLTGERVPE